ncbi:MAG TPA: UDP-N-acetylmuramoyl-tripeptide--D-alanyl-D-alanine ligase [Dehalococcoidia bacterium]|nr:UDP-N-acetylmuramoyl-tripeptide--D-alanyl-D-alanine ligase [Dehalococcoidia bacterium]
MTAFALATAALAALRTARAALLYISLWQVREYRWDRFRAFLGTRAARALALHPLPIARLALLATLVAIARWAQPGEAALAAVAALYALEVGLGAREAVARTIRRPARTLRALALTAAVVFAGWAAIGGAVAAAMTADLDDHVRWFSLALAFLAIDRLLPFAAGALVLAARLPNQALVALDVQRARRAMRGSRAVVVGITGSYGKTSTKTFLATILSQRRRVWATPGSVNTLVGVARLIARSGADYDVMIVEMGAYREGEIRAICELVRPRIGVLTAVAEQHLALFGSIERTLEAKFELIEALPPDGLAVLNGNDARIRARSEGVAVPRRFYSATGPADVWAKDVAVGRDALEFTVVYGQEEARFRCGVLGRQNVEPLLAATSVALELGMTLAEVRDAASAVKPVRRTMEPGQLPGGATCIDDTFSASRAAILAALDFLAEAPAERRFIVISGVPELAELTRPVHEEIGVRMSQVCDRMIAVNGDYAPFYERAMDEAARNGRFFFEPDPAKAAALLADLCAGDIVLFEGRGAERVLDRLRGRAEGK